MHIPDHLKPRKLRSNALKEAREKAGVTKMELSAKSNITRKTIDRIESSRGSWNVDTEIMYMQALGLLAFQPVYGEEGGKMVVVKMAMIPAK